MCIFAVISIFKYYTGHNTPVYTCFLDASKASQPLDIIYTTYEQWFFTLNCSYSCILVSDSDLIFRRTLLGYYAEGMHANL